MIEIHPAVIDAQAKGTPIVALESSVFAQGLPDGANAEAARRMYAAIESRGALPAVTAVIHGVPLVGVDAAQLDRLLARTGFEKVSARDLAPVIARKGNGATTVAATLALASRAGLDVFATGGIGGVHRAMPGEIAWDESADLVELSRTSMIVVCAGAKSILDLPATWERLDTLGIPVIGYRTRELPAFFSTSSGIRLTHVAESADEIAAVFRVHRALARPQALLVVQPPPAEVAIDSAVVDRIIGEALAELGELGVRGAAVTPHLLSALAARTEGATLKANLGLLETNAALAAEISVALRATRR